MVFCKSTFLYKSGNIRIEAEARVKVGAQEIVGVRMKEPLRLIKMSLASSSLLVRVELWQVYGLIIILKENYKISISFK